MSDPAHKPLVLIASYPKSGNTWFRALLSNYFAQGDGAVPLDSFIGGPDLSRRPVFEDHTGLDPAFLDRAEIDSLRAAVSRGYAAETTFPCFVKVHDAHGPAALGVTLFDPGVVRQVVYLVRDPRDVLPSYAYHLRKPLDETLRRMCDPGAELFDRPGRDQGQVVQRLGRWDTHVTGWLDQRDLPLTCLRYEDLKADPEGAFGRTLAAIGIAPDPARLARAVTASAHDALRAQEAAGIFPEKNPEAPDFFGRQTREAQRPGPGDDAAVEAAFAPVMARLGYL
ncbi:sulfotransferase domain-containing protein [Anianabacter salinae]|uniref:sulfotransferase domain-containing protein n=1 Tax=Anianabacter salinae TaxID=2851023 RepID=UPI00225DD20B|nr:sulfotransferase domain-containing protein [Anianabacter salinae]MBV0913044.1 sulfotransferase domain-containing protein [Anianabacter salinae]